MLASCPMRSCVLGRQQNLDGCIVPEQTKCFMQLIPFEGNRVWLIFKMKPELKAQTAAADERM